MYDLSFSERSCAAGHGASSPWGLGVKDFFDLPLSAGFEAIPKFDGRWS